MNAARANKPKHAIMIARIAAGKDVLHALHISIHRCITLVKKIITHRLLGKALPNTADRCKRRLHIGAFHLHRNTITISQNHE